VSLILPWVTFREQTLVISRECRSGDDPGVFERIFLIVAVQPGEKVFTIYAG